MIVKIYTGVEVWVVKMKQVFRVDDEVWVVKMKSGELSVWETAEDGEEWIASEEWEDLDNWGEMWRGRVVGDESVCIRLLEQEI